MDTTSRPSNDHLNDWLRDAHAMEEQAETMLSSMLSRIKNYPELSQRISQHIEETRGQQAVVKRCLERRGQDNSTMKDMAAKAMATFQGFSGALASDEIVKGSMFSFAFENLEIAAYKNIIEAARYVGDTETAVECERILQEEIAMAQWLEKNTGAVVRHFLMLADEPDATAKR